MKLIPFVRKSFQTFRFAGRSNERSDYIYGLRKLYGTDAGKKLYEEITSGFNNLIDSANSKDKSYIQERFNIFKRLVADYGNLERPRVTFDDLRTVLGDTVSVLQRSKTKPPETKSNQTEKNEKSSKSIPKHKDNAYIRQSVSNIVNNLLKGDNKFAANQLNGLFKNIPKNEESDFLSKFNTEIVSSLKALPHKVQQELLKSVVDFIENDKQLPENDSKLAAKNDAEKAVSAVQLAKKRQSGTSKLDDYVVRHIRNLLAERKDPLAIQDLLEKFNSGLDEIVEKLSKGEIVDKNKLDSTLKKLSPITSPSGLYLHGAEEIAKHFDNSEITEKLKKYEPLFIGAGRYEKFIEYVENVTGRTLDYNSENKTVKLTGEQSKSSSSEEPKEQQLPEPTKDLEESSIPKQEESKVSEKLPEVEEQKQEEAKASEVEVLIQSESELPPQKKTKKPKKPKQEEAKASEVEEQKPPEKTEDEDKTVKIVVETKQSEPENKSESLLPVIVKEETKEPKIIPIIQEEKSMSTPDFDKYKPYSLPSKDSLAEIISSYPSIHSGLLPLFNATRAVPEEKLHFNLQYLLGNEVYDYLLRTAEKYPSEIPKIIESIVKQKTNRTTAKDPTKVYERLGLESPDFYDDSSPTNLSELKIRDLRPKSLERLQRFRDEPQQRRMENNLLEATLLEPLLKRQYETIMDAKAKDRSRDDLGYNRLMQELSEKPVGRMTDYELDHMLRHKEEGDYVVSHIKSLADLLGLSNSDSFLRTTLGNNPVDNFGRAIKPLSDIAKSNRGYLDRTYRKFNKLQRLIKFVKNKIKSRNV